MQHRRDVVDGGDIHRIDDRGLVDVAHEGDLAAIAAGDGPVAAQHESIGLDADRAQGGDRVLGRLRLLLAAGAHEGHERHVHEEHVAAAQLVAHLAGGLDEWLRLDVADRAADLGDDHVGLRVVLRLQAHAALDLVGDVRDHLHGVAEVLAAALARDHLRVDLPGRDIRGRAEVDVEEALVVPDVEVGLGAVISDEHLAVLERVHRARVDVEVRVELLHHDAQSARGEEVADAGGGQALAEGGDHAPGHEDVLGCPCARARVRSVRHGPLAYPTRGRSALDARCAVSVQCAACTRPPVLVPFQHSSRPSRPVRS